MKPKIITTIEDIDINKLAQMYSQSPIGIKDLTLLANALSKSHKSIVIEIENKYVAAGRSISDGRYTFLIDLVVLQEFKMKGFGKLILEELLKGEDKNFVYLNSTWEAENFYKKMGFKKQKTGYARYPFSSDYLSD